MEIDRPGDAPLTEEQEAVLASFRSKLEAILSDGRVDPLEVQALVNDFRSHRELSSRMMDVMGELWPADVDVTRPQWD
ncbi:hypothetical protein EVJ50_10010 [Synechococcus sp. RSCCF101]|uniref:hypothetical protein n=1 Tax=Synechococcus sp. RSCCF101 TaxID=2511069 RepID=UPI001248ADD4|nr:hypothetical protein [Synechococcus sp. RSCCF101]QEY32501.1 hypothetical protein EVJ50_10010 [Synechococcus sp. RSCCF101]